jgi:hypothetical protein
MWEIMALLLLASLIWFGAGTLRMREHALDAARFACERHRLQFLDESVHCIYLRPARDHEGRLRWRRVYRFEFTDNGEERRRGHVTFLGAVREDLTLDPFLH